MVGQSQCQKLMHVVAVVEVVIVGVSVETLAVGEDNLEVLN